jgi:hypothetical protein
MKLSIIIKINKKYYNQNDISYIIIIVNKLKCLW